MEHVLLANNIKENKTNYNRKYKLKNVMLNAVKLVNNMKENKNIYNGRNKLKPELEIEQVCLVLHL